MGSAAVPATPMLRPIHTRTAALGLLFISAGALVFTVAAAFSEPEILMFFVPSLVVATVAAGLVWRFGTWAKAVGIVAALAAGGFMFWSVFGLAEPASFVDFVPGVLIPGGIILAIGGNVAALMHSRRGRLEATATHSERRIQMGAIAVVLAAAVISAGMTFAGRTSVDAAAAAGAIPAPIEAGAFNNGDGYTVPGGSTMLVRNSDPFVHTFTVPALGIDEKLGPGSEALVSVPESPGSYVLYCIPHSNTSEPDPAKAGMAAPFTIQ